MILLLSELTHPCLPPHSNSTATNQPLPISTVSATPLVFFPLVFFKYVENLSLFPLDPSSSTSLSPNFPTSSSTTMIPKLFQIILIYYILATTTTTTSASHRRMLHHPFFPVETPSSSPELQPQPPPPQPKYPFTSLPPPTDPQNANPFFPFYSAPQPPPSPPPPSHFSAAATFPANISSLIIPHSSASSSSSTTSGKPISGKFIALIVCFSLLSASLIIAFAAFLLHRHQFHHRRQLGYSKTDSLHLFPPDTTPSDTITTVSKLKKPLPMALPKLIRPSAAASTSSEFLYLGTLVSSREVNSEAIDSQIFTNPSSVDISECGSQHFQTLGSPELHPLPPLPRNNFQNKPNFNNYNTGSDDEEEFFSPRASTGVDKFSKSPEVNIPSSGTSYPVQIFRSQSSNSSHHSNQDSPIQPSSSPSIILDFTPMNSIISKSPDSLVNFPGPLRGIPPPPPRERKPLSPSASDFESSPSRVSSFSSTGISGRFPGVRLPPPVPPPLPPRYWEAPVVGSGGPPSLVAPSRAVGSVSEGNERTNDNNLKPKLKPLHWDKVKASSDKTTVWDHLKSSSFQLNEEMIETLFMVNGSSNSSNPGGKKRSVSPLLNQEFQVLDPKKSQNIAILLRALNVTIDEVCEALIEGNADMLGTELLESLLKMAPTHEEEQKLKEFKDESPFKLGPAEKFLKAVLHIPHAFSRVDAMLYIANFDSEVEYLKKSFQTLEEACKELKNSRMFLKLLEAVLKTGNRMNDGTNRGDAHAFNLDTLLKLVDVKGIDGKTTLLHFVVQEIIKAEGSRRADTDHNIPNVESNQNEVELRKRGLEVVSSLSGELSNVRKAAAMDSDMFNSDVLKLSSGITKVIEILKLNEELPLTDSRRRFSESMNDFLKKAEEDIIKIQAQESVTISMVKELTEYFHGNSSTKDVEAHPFRIFMVVRDFLSILDQVCKDVGKMNDRSMVSTSREFLIPINKPSLPQVFSGLEKEGLFSEEDESMF